MKIRLAVIELGIFAFLSLCLLPSASFAAPDKWLASNYTSGGDFFGRALALSGDTILVGAYGSNAGGAASVFVYDDGIWVEQARFTSNLADDSFGYSVALDGDTALVGAYSADTESGAVYIFVRSASGYWKEQARLTGLPGERFGYDVSLSSDTAVIGTDSRGEADSFAYVFIREGTGWRREARLNAAGTTGNPVSIAGDTILLGAYRKNNYAGAAYVFTRSRGAWVRTSELAAADLNPGDWFGSEVSLTPGRAIIGAFRKDKGAGAAYIFVQNGAEWRQEIRLSAPSAAPDDFFGAAAAIDGDLALVGAYHRMGDVGSGYIFRRDVSGWSPAEIVSPVNSNPRDWLGYSVTVSGPAAAMGAPTRQDQGMVYFALTEGIKRVSKMPLSASPPSEVDTRSAVMNAVINHIGSSGTASVYFEYGPASTTINISTRYTRITEAQAPSAAGPFGLKVTGLLPNTTYHYRSVAETEDGLAFGPDTVFKTEPLPPPSTTIMVEPPVIIEPPSPLYLWLAANFKIYATIFVIMLILTIIVSKHREDKQRALRASNTITGRLSSKSDYDDALNKITVLIEQRKAGLITEDQYAAQKSEIVRNANKSKG